MFVKLTNGQPDQFPYTVGQIRRDNPQTSFPKVIPDEMFADYGVFPVVVQARPEFDVRTQKLAVATEPALVSGAWTMIYTVADKTAEDIANYDSNVASGVRSERDKLLRESDWEIVKASEERMKGNPNASPATAILDYRQALRDITNQAGFPYEVTWPTKP